MIPIPAAVEAEFAVMRESLPQRCSTDTILWHVFDGDYPEFKNWIDGRAKQTQKRFVHLLMDRVGVEVWKERGYGTPKVWVIR